MTRAAGPGEIQQTIVQEPMVGWFSPGQLVRTAIRALLGTVFGAYADRREIQAALVPNSPEEEAQELERYSGTDELWIDYVSDVGDGWDSTYSIAWLLAQERLRLDGVDTPRGHLLVMGGDQVYPTATRSTYQNRFTGPYTAALPWTEGDSQGLYVLPGNHDWYDGLTSFLKLFCQQRWIGGRKTQQRRSYFALKLPHGWWLWAVDIQLEADIDEPQKHYFEHFASKLEPGDRVILCTPTSSWVDAGDARVLPDPDSAGAHPNLTYLEAMIARAKAEVVLNLAGDLHHYSHYVQSSGGRHKFTAGGGGAFLRGTHDLPRELTLTEAGTENKYRRVSAYPDDKTSRRLRWGNLLFFVRNPAFSLFVGFLYLFYTWIWQSASKVPLMPGSLMERLDRVPASFGSFFAIVLPDLVRTLAHRPGSMLVTLVLPVATWGFSNPPPRQWGALRKMLWGPGHGIAHLFLGVALLWLFATINLGSLAGLPQADVEAWMDSPWQALLFSAEMLASGFLLGGILTGLYLALSNALSDLHADESFSSLHIPDYKNFLRLHLGPEGVTVYPVAMDRACRKWNLSPAANGVTSSGWLRRVWNFNIAERQTAPWFSPAADIPVRLIEKPVLIASKGRRSDARS